MKNNAHLLVLILGSALFVLVLLFTQSEKMFQQLESNHRQKREHIILESENQQSIEAYNYWIRSAKSKINKSDYEGAYRDYMKAHEINNCGRRANIGITACLLHRCKQDRTSCKAAYEHFEQLIASNVVTDVDIAELQR